MRDSDILGIKIEEIKNSSKNKSSKKRKGFGTQILGFGSGGGAAPYDIQYLVIAQVLEVFTVAVAEQEDTDMELFLQSQ